jgi:hypothetical protein
MTLDDRVNLLLGITGFLPISQLQSQRNRTSREERESEIESMRFVAPS